MLLSNFPCRLCKVSISLFLTALFSVLPHVFRRLDFNSDLDSQNKTTYLAFQVLNVNMSEIHGSSYIPEPEILGNRNISFN